MGIGDIVCCNETGRHGMVIEKKRGYDCMFLLIVWSDETSNWVDAVDLRKVEYTL